MKNEENNVVKNALIGVISILIVAIVGLGIYTTFIKEDNLPQNNNTGNNNSEAGKVKVFTRLDKVTLTQNNQTININGKDIKIKVVDEYLFINDKNTEINVEIGYIYVSDYLIFIYNDGREYAGLNTALNENSKVVEIVPLIGDDDYEYIPFVELYLEDGKLMGKNYSGDCEYSKNPSDCYYSYYQFLYDGNKITIKEVNKE